MKGTYCDDKGGWTTVGYLNMSESGITSPTGLTKSYHLNIDDACGQSRSTSYVGRCSLSIFSTIGLNYYKVFGQVRGYQVNSPDGFYCYYNNQNISGPYVDGISITHGQSTRQHIWSYAAGHGGNPGRCPCETPSIHNFNPPPPSFVGNHYYCEAGGDVLWDGKDCPGSEAPCCTNTKQPWFYRELDDMTQDSIELRVCDDQGYHDEAVPIDFIELYVQ